MAETMIKAEIEKGDGNMKRTGSIALALCLVAGLLAGSNLGMFVSASASSVHPGPQYPISNPQPPASNTSTFTLSGTIRDPDGVPVPDVEVGVSSEYEWDEDTTDDNGFYSVQVAGPTWLRFYIEPLVETQLARVVIYAEGPFNSNTTLDFDLVAGHLFSGEVRSPSGDSVYLPWGADIIALTNPPPADEVAPLNESFSFSTNWRDGTFQTVLPPGVYSVVVRYTPRPYYPTRVTVDLRSGDVVNYDFTLNVVPEPLPGTEPPNAALISLGAPDAGGYLSVTGAPGAVTPFAAVFIAHMTSGRWTSSVAGEDGSFSATAYGPPGSHIIIKQDPSHWYYNGFMKGADPYEDDDGVISSSNLDPLASATLRVPIGDLGTRGHGDTGTTSTSSYLRASTSPSLRVPLVGSGVINPYDGAAMWEVTGEISAADTLKRVDGGTLNGALESGLYAGGIYRAKPALADLDGNGDLDLFIGDYNGYIVHYRNDGLIDSGMRVSDFGFSLSEATARNLQSEVRNVDWTFVTDRWENMDISWSTSPAFVDIDYDGDQDLLAGTGGGEITFFRNIGTPTTPAWRFVTDEYEGIDVGSYATLAFADIDADDDYDLFIGNSDGYVVFYRNIGTREEAVWMFVTDDYLGTNVSGSAQPALADVDDDGDLDFFVGANHEISHWRNDGAPTAPSWTLATHQYANIYEPSSMLAPAFADLDEDGDLDMLLGWKFGPIRTYTNLGTPSNPVWARTVDDTCPLDLGGYSTPALGDWDGDGDLDMLVGDYHKRVRMVQNEGGQWDGGRWTDVGLVTAVNPDDLYHAAPTLVDIDDDGDLDLFVGEDDGMVDFLTNLGSQTDPNWTLTAIGYQGFDVGTHAKPTFGDLDSDGDYDLLIGEKYGRLRFYENTGTPTSPSWATPDHYFESIDVGYYSAPLLTDLDGDLDPDLLIGDDDGRIWAYENNGGAFTLLTQDYGAARPDDHAAPAVGDLNDDGWPDLVVGSLAGGVQAYLNRSGEPASEGLQPGDALTASGVMRITSTGLPPGFDPSTVYLGGSFEPRPFFDADGRPHGTNNQFNSTLMTPSGFPVERYASWYNRWASYFEMTDKRMVDEHTIEADFEVTMYLPDDFPAGWYLPTLELSFGSIPGGTGETMASVFTSNRARNLAPGSMVKVGEPATPHLPWVLLADTFSNATRGAMPAADAASLTGAPQVANRRIYQADAFFVPRSDPRSDAPFTYRLEPFMPLASVSDHSLPHQPFIPFAFPSGQLHVTVQQPDGAVDDLGTAPFTQSTSRTPVMLNGSHYEGCSGSVGDMYQLITNPSTVSEAASGHRSGQFDYQFSQYGRHVITMTGTIEDIWGNTYTGGGAYEVVVGREIHIHPGAIPGTPFEVGDTLAPTLRLSPGVPADVTVRLRLYRNSDPDDVLDQTITGQANRFGYFHPGDGSGLVFDAPGEYRVDVTAVYTDTDGVVWVGSQSWGNVVETPDTRLVAHGRRGISQSYTRTQWFVRSTTGEDGGHINFPFASGDVAWAPEGDKTGAKITFQDPDGATTQVLRERAALSYPSIRGPGDIENRIAMGEAPLFSVAAGPSDPAYTLNPLEQVGYTYRVAQRPGISVHQQVTEDSVHAPIWQFSNRHSSQIGMGMDGERPNDFKWHFGGVVLRDLVEGWNQYAIYGSLWVELPGDDPIGSRVMPPFQGAAGGPSGGPLLTVKGEEIDTFIEPTGVKPGAVLEVGDTFAFAGQMAPPLASQVDVVVTSPSQVTHEVHGRANKIGYFYDPSSDFTVDEAGVWTVDVTVTHDGMTSAGPVDPPYPTGGVLGTESGRYEFYVVEPAEPRATVNAPTPGWLQMYRDWDVAPVNIAVPVPQDWTDVVLRYVVAMPGWVLQTGELTSPGKAFVITYDAETLRDTFPNIDLRQPQSWAPGLSDEVFINFVISGNKGGNPRYRANALTLHGEQLLFEGYGQPQAAPASTVIPRDSEQQHRRDVGSDIHTTYLPVIMTTWSQRQSARPPWCREEVDGNCAPPAPEETLEEYVDMDDPNQYVGRER
ncbi:MAG: hypothetical protein MAG451_00703 [Anaerolineales bacterium]|nr:hypothetical protein [Anaerolineales bacterium]